MPRARGPATASRLADALGGGPFVVTGPEPVETTVSGSMGRPDRPTGITLRCRVGPQRRTVEVQTWARGDAAVPYSDAALVPRLFYGARLKVRYPLVIERSTLRIRVGARLRAFKG